MIISLTGFMGCGKSSVGRRLSELLCCPFMDLDDVIVESAGRSIPEIFASDGEAEFRKMEKDALSDMVRQSLDTQATEVSAVIALGGGTVMTDECARIIHEQTMCIYLRASVETLASHLEGESEGRPMLHGDLRSRIGSLMDLRSSRYENTAHVIIDTDGKSIEDICSEIKPVL